MNSIYRALYSGIKEIRTELSKAVRVHLMAAFPQAVANVDWSILDVEPLDPRGAALTVKIRVVMMPRKEEETPD